MNTERESFMSQAILVWKNIYRFTIGQFQGFPDFGRFLRELPSENPIGDASTLFDDATENKMPNKKSFMII